MELARRCGGRVVASSASRIAALGDPAALQRLESDPDRWIALAAWTGLARSAEATSYVFA